MKSKAQLKFEEQRKDLTDREIMLELLYANYLTYRAANNTRSNTGTLVWFVIIGVLVSIGATILSLLAIS